MGIWYYSAVTAHYKRILSSVGNPQKRKRHEKLDHLRNPRFCFGAHRLCRRLHRAWGYAHVDWRQHHLRQLLRCGQLVSVPDSRHRRHARLRGRDAHLARERHGSRAGLVRDHLLRERQFVRPRGRLHALRQQAEAHQNYCVRQGNNRIPYRDIRSGSRVHRKRQLRHRRREPQQPPPHVQQKILRTVQQGAAKPISVRRHHHIQRPDRRL